MTEFLQSFEAVASCVNEKDKHDYWKGPVFFFRLEEHSDNSSCCAQEE